MIRKWPAVRHDKARHHAGRFVHVYHAMHARIGSTLRGPFLLFFSIWLFLGHHHHAHIRICWASSCSYSYGHWGRGHCVVQLARRPPRDALDLFRRQAGPCCRGTHAHSPIQADHSQQQGAVSLRCIRGRGSRSRVLLFKHLFVQISVRAFAVSHGLCVV